MKGYQIKKHLQKIIRTKDVNDITNEYLCLDRNERQISFTKSFNNKIKKLPYDELIRSYPNQYSLLGKLSKLTGYPKEALLYSL